MIRRTWLLKPSARPLLIFSRIAARIPSRCLRMVLAVLTNASMRDRLALEIHRSMSSVACSVFRSPAKMALVLQPGVVAYDGSESFEVVAGAGLGLSASSPS
jgi:hypothetical protein